MDQDECNLLIDYVRSLPVPVATKPADDKIVSQIKAGEATFKTIGCASCHLPKLGEVEGIFSDLLLHDMGLSSAIPTRTPSSPVNHQGRAVPEPADPDRTRPGTGTASAREWRTPPLWGLRDSGPYLHDGRAARIAEAITMHGGQGATAARRFADLPPGASNNSKRSSCRSPRLPRIDDEIRIDRVNEPGGSSRSLGSLHGRTAQLLQSAAKVPHSQLVQPVDRIALVKLELGRHVAPSTQSAPHHRRSAQALASISPSRRCSPSPAAGCRHRMPGHAPLRGARVTGQSAAPCRHPRAGRFHPRLPVAIIVPSPLNARQSIGPRCESGSPIGRIVSVSQSLAVPSWLVVAIDRPPGL